MKVKIKKLIKTQIILFSIILFASLFLSVLTSQISNKYDIISPFQVKAMECGDSKLCKDLGLEKVGLFDKLPVLDMSEYEGAEGIGLLLIRGLACLFPLTIIFAFAIMFKILIPALSPFGEPSEEKYKTAKKKFIELGMALLLPIIIVLAMAIISISFGVASPFSSEFYKDTLGIQFGFESGTGGGGGSSHWNHSRVVSCTRKYDVTDEENRGACIDEELNRCYDEVKKEFGFGTGTPVTKEYNKQIALCMNSSRKDRAELVCYESCYQEHKDLGSGPRQADSECKEICGL